MKRHCITYILGLLFVFGCNNYDKTKWRILEGNELAKQDESYDVIKFVNDSTGFLGGRHSKYTFDLENQSLKERIDKTVLYKTINKGRNWRKLDLEFDGNISEIKIYGDTLFALNQYIYSNSSILVSYDAGLTWKKHIEFEKDFYVRGYFYSCKKGLLVAIDDKKSLNLISFNSRIDTIQKFSKFHYHVKIGEEKIYLVHSSGGANSDAVIIYNYTSDEQQTIPFNNDYWISSIELTPKNDYYIAVDKNNKHSKILKLDNDRFTEINLGDYSSYSLGQLYVADSLILINSNKRENVGPIGVTHELLYSSDNGKNWISEDYPFSLITEPADLIEDGTFISWQGLRKFQMRIKSFANNVYTK